MAKSASILGLPKFTSFRGSLSIGLIGIFIIGLATVLCLPFISSPVKGQTAQPTISIYDPRDPTDTIITSVEAEPLTVKVKVSNFSDLDGLSAFSFKLTYDLRHAYFQLGSGGWPGGQSAFSFGTFLSSTGRQKQCNELFTVETDAADENLRRFSATCVTLGTSPLGPTGTGDLATITFSPRLEYGRFVLQLSETQLVDTNSSNPQLIPHTTVSIPVQITKCADLDNDGLVRVNDIILVANHYLTNDETYDLDGDELVRVSDILVAIAQYFRSC